MWLSVYTSTTGVQLPEEARRVCHAPQLGWHEVVMHPMWVLGIKPRPSARAGITHPLSPASLKWKILTSRAECESSYLKRSRLKVDLPSSNDLIKKRNPHRFSCSSIYSSCCTLCHPQVSVVFVQFYRGLVPKGQVEHTGRRAKKPLIQMLPPFSLWNR